MSDWQHQQMLENERLRKAEAEATEIRNRQAIEDQRKANQAQLDNMWKDIERIRRASQSETPWFEQSPYPSESFGGSGGNTEAFGKFMVFGIACVIFFTLLDGISNLPRRLKEEAARVEKEKAMQNRPAGEKGLDLLKMPFFSILIPEPEAPIGTRGSCLWCHTLDGEEKAAQWRKAPTFKGLYGSKRKLLAGREVVADDAYIAQSIREPYNESAMGNYWVCKAGEFPNRSEEDIANIIEAIKSLK